MPDETTNFQNLFSQYGSGADYATALDYSLKVDENLPLIPGTKNTDPNAGTWQYLSRLYTIGYGYDFSTKNGAQIEADFQSARIALPTSVLDALADYTIALRSATPAQIAESQEELDDVSDEMNAWSPNLTDAQATALMQPPIAVAQKSVIGEIANYITSNNTTITYSEVAGFIETPFRFL
jgi:hypothetical protein